MIFLYAMCLCAPDGNLDHNFPQDYYIDSVIDLMDCDIEPFNPYEDE